MRTSRKLSLRVVMFKLDFHHFYLLQRWTIMHFSSLISFLLYPPHYIRLPMLLKYKRQANSQKYSKYSGSTHSKYPQVYDMTLADMDVGQFAPLHNRVMDIFAAMQDEIINQDHNQDHNPNHNHNHNHREYEKQIRQKYEQVAKQSIVDWYCQQYSCNLSLRPSHKSTPVSILFATSVVSFCSYCIIACTQPGDGVLIATPVYAAYGTIIGALGRKAVATQLITSPTHNKLLTFQFNLAQIQQLVLTHRVRLLLLSQPHNPSGQAWSQSQIRPLVSLCYKHSIVVVSDQILCDLSLLNGPLYSLAHELPHYGSLVVMNSVSKGFNYSSVQGGYAIIGSAGLSDRIGQVMRVYGEQIDDLGLSCIVGCLSHVGRSWLHLITQIIASNYRKLVLFRDHKKPLLQIYQLDASYLVCIDACAYFPSAQVLRQAMKQYNCYVMELGSNFVPHEQQCLLVRLCIACEESIFDGFLARWQDMLSMKIKAKL